MAIFLGKQFLGQRDTVEVQRPEDDALTLFIKKIDDEAGLNHAE